MKTKSDLIVKSFCANCRNFTNHTVKKMEAIDYADDDAGYFSRTEWQIIECNGCNQLSFRLTDSNNQEYDEDGYRETVLTFPRSGTEVLPIRPYFHVNGLIRNIYRETIDAYNNGLFTLCAAGLRAIIESICIDKGIKDGPVEVEKGGVKKVIRKRDLQGRIFGLSENGMLTKKHANALHQHRFMGNDAVHQLDQPSREELKIAIEIIEHILDGLYEIDRKARILSERISERRSSKKSI